MCIRFMHLFIGQMYTMNSVEYQNLTLISQFNVLVEF